MCPMCSCSSNASRAWTRRCARRSTRRWSSWRIGSSTEFHHPDPHEDDMNSFPSRRWIAQSFGAALLAASFSTQAGVGARVMLQTWSPTTPKQQGLQVLVNDASIVSDQLQKAYTLARPRLCAQLVSAMGKGKAAAGQTLRDITCLLDEH